jgi:hypothetical protein
MVPIRDHDLLALIPRDKALLWTYGIIEVLYTKIKQKKSF